MFQKFQCMALGPVFRAPTNPTYSSTEENVNNPNSNVNGQPGGANPTEQLPPSVSNSGLPTELPSGGLSSVPQHVR